MLTHRACRAAVLGSPIGHSLSPVLHRAAYRDLGLTDWSFDAVAVGGPGEPTLPQFLSGLGPEWVGFAVTMPLKEEALAVATAASGHARDLGAANTLVRREGGWVAHSTDSAGVLGALVDAGVPAPRRAVVLGAGATARSVVDALVRLGVREVLFATRRGARAETVAFARGLGVTVAEAELGDGLGALAASAEVTVSTVPTGTELALPPLAGEALAGRVVMDVVYGGWPTPLARWAQGAGARVVSGREMLLHQAIEQVELMTGARPRAEALRAALHEAAYVTR